jgi:hypothetical protein
MTKNNMLTLIKNIKIKTYKKKTLQEERRRTNYIKICYFASHIFLRLSSLFIGSKQTLEVLEIP